MPSRDAKTTYAQSSDIKSRSYLEYRKDMKNKAIVELELLDWLPSRLKSFFNASDIKVEKAGGDAFLWFLRGGGVSREADYRAIVDGKLIAIEFQYAEKKNLKFYDFKISKVGRKVRGKDKRVPKDVLFLYIHKPLRKFALLEASWIMEHGEIGPVPAWGSRLAYRVPREIFEAQLQEDEQLPTLLERIDCKKLLLNFQYYQMNKWRQMLQVEMEGVIDEENLLVWHPKELLSFFKVCFTLEHLDRTPRNAPLWLVYATSYLRVATSLEEIAWLTFVIDYLYGRIPVGGLERNELEILTEALPKIKDVVLGKAQPNGAFISSPRLSPIDETRLALFALNLLEDLFQDMVYYYHANLPVIRRIYEWLPEVMATCTFINEGKARI